MRSRETFHYVTKPFTFHCKSAVYVKDKHVRHDRHIQTHALVLSFIHGRVAHMHTHSTVFTQFYNVIAANMQFW